MLRLLCTLGLSMFFAGCAQQQPAAPAVVSVSSSSASAVVSSAAPVEDLPLEQLPSEMSIEHFGRMRLEGTGLTLDSVEAKNDAYVRHRISYRSNGLKITGILNIPAGQGPFPLLVFNHGYIDPAVYTQGRGLKREQDYMARRGFAVLHTDYRGHAGGDKSPMPEDAKVYDGALEYAMDSVNAVNAVRAAKLPQIDASRVGMLGHSMGGGVTLAILTARPDLVSAAVLYAPVHADVWENFSRWRAEREEGDRTITEMGTRADNPAAWDALSPETYLDRIKAPVLLFQGAKDKDVPQEWSDHLARRLEEEGKDATYVEYPNEGHEFGPQWNDFMAKSAAFFTERLAVR